MSESRNVSNVKEILFIIAEFLLLVLKIIYYICEATYKLIVPKKEKIVTGEIVLVCTIFVIHVPFHYKLNL